MTERHTPKTKPIGGDYELDWRGLCDEGYQTPLFSKGRDALKALVRCECRPGSIWLVPDFMCPVVPLTLKDCGMRPLPYPWLTPWRVDESHLRGILAKASGIVVPFYMGLPPSDEIWGVVRGADLCVVEDLCQCVGPPPPAKALRGDYAIGSFRKWMATPDGAYCVKRSGKAPQPERRFNEPMVAARLAAALGKRVRNHGLASEADRALEQAMVAMFSLGEDSADGDSGVGMASPLSAKLVATADFDFIRKRRLRNQTWLISQLRQRTRTTLLESGESVSVSPQAPMLALPILCMNRDRVRKRLAACQIYCAVHWADGNWSGRSRGAALVAAQELSLPIDQRYELKDLERLVDLLV